MPIEEDSQLSDDDSLADPSSCTELSLTDATLCNESVVFARTEATALQLERLGEEHAIIRLERDELKASVVHT